MFENSNRLQLDDAYDVWHEKVHGQEDPTLINLEDWHKNALSLAPNLKGLKVLEVGCGVGDFAIYLNNEGANVTAVDFSKKAIELAKEKGKVRNCRINFQIADAQSLPFPDDEFDLIFSCECLEHIPEPKLALKEMNRVLKKSAKVILTTENYSNAVILYWIKCWLTKELFNSGNEVQPIDHFFLFWNIQSMFHNTGFKVKKLIGSHHVFLLLPRFHPHTFVIEKFNNPFFASMFKPFARHMTYLSTKK